MTMRAPAAMFLTGAAMTLVSATSVAQTGDAASYPSRPLRFVVPFPPGGSNDIIARSLALKLADDLGQQVVVDNRGGANGIIGTDLVAKSPPDGHTFLIAGNGFVINVSMYRKLPYRVPADFAAVSLVGSGGFVLVVHPSLAPRSVGELIALAQASPHLHPGEAGCWRPAEAALRHRAALLRRVVWSRWFLRPVASPAGWVQVPVGKGR